ncbi:MAG: MFS transporter [Acidobacteriota bacterium]
MPSSSSGGGSAPPAGENAPSAASVNTEAGPVISRPRLSLGSKLALLGALYIASGLPLVIAQKVWPVIWRQAGASLTAVGLISLLSLPWTIKVFWAPLVDRFGQRRHWISAALAFMALSCAGQAMAMGQEALLWGAGFIALLFLFTLASATQDVALDAYAVELAEPGQEGPINSVRVVAYRFAMAAGGGALLALGPKIGWPTTWWLLALLLGVASLAALRVPEGRKSTSSASMKSLVSASLRWLRQPAMLPALLLVLLYKVGDYALSPMTLPFWVDAGYGTAEIGAVAVTLGTLASVLGALLGGWGTARWGTIPALLFFGLAQGLSNLGYALAAALDLGRAGLWTVTLVENFCQGLAVTAFLAFLMALCGKEAAATRFAVLTALSALPRELVGGFSGLAADALGYGPYFALTTVLALPGLLLIPRVAPLVQSAVRNK